MIKKIIYLFVLITTISCNNEDAGDCLQTAGDIIQEEIEVVTFTKVLVNKKIELFVTQGPIQKVVVETGENLLNDISVEVIDNQLVLTNYNTCNLLRDYGITKIHITSPNLTEIRNASELNVSSIGTLTYPKLYLQSTGEKNKFLSVGDWHLAIENEQLTIWCNGIANFYMNGKTKNLNMAFTDGDSRFEGENFKANHINVSHVTSNDLLIFPIESLKGSIHSTGNLIVYNTPPLVEVDELSVGKIIFK
jgi:hypothetical protein